MTSSITPFSLAATSNFSRILVCAHDAGAAYLILHWVKHFPQKCFFVLSGPALNIFREYFGVFTNHQLNDIISICDCMISGTSWSCDIEDKARQLAKKHHIFSISVIDHWVNYIDRFTFSGFLVLPDLLWVSDFYAYTIASETFPNLDISLIENSWLVYIQNQVLSKSSRTLANNLTQDFRILYLLEPIRSEWDVQHSVPEYHALKYLLSSIELLIESGYLPSNKKLQFMLRPHPAQDISFYFDFLEEFSSIYSFTIDSDPHLHHSLSKCDLVCGLNSQALTIALACNITAISVLPPNVPRCVLPHTQLVHLNNLQ